MCLNAVVFNSQQFCLITSPILESFICLAAPILTVSVYGMEQSDLSNFDISTEMVAKLKAIGIESLYNVQAQTYEHIKNGDDIITLASKLTTSSITKK